MPVSICTFVTRTCDCLICSRRASDQRRRRFTKPLLSKIDCQNPVEHTGSHSPIDERSPARVLTNVIKKSHAKPRSIHLKTAEWNRRQQRKRRNGFALFTPFSPVKESS